MPGKTVQERSSESTVTDDQTPFMTSVDTVPVTKDRPVFVPKSDSPLAYPGVPRATIAASTESPEGTTQLDYANKHTHQTVLQQHCTYWDPDNDGIIWPTDTYNGVRAWGWMIPLALLATFIIHGALSLLTVPGWLPDPFFRIWLSRIHKDKHGSDTGTYDNEGRFRSQNFEEIFTKYDKGNKGGLDKSDILDMMHGQRVAIDPFGSFAAAFEWLATYLLIWPRDGIMRKEDIRGIYDGSIFYRKAAEHAVRSHRGSKALEASK